MSNNSKTVRDTRNMSLNHDYETGIALSDSVNKPCVKRLLADKSLWRHFRLAIKPCHLENHASQLKNYYGTLIGSHGPSFRIRHIKERKAPLGGEFTMTSYPVGNKTSLSRKPCIPNKKLIWNTIQEVIVALSEFVMENRLKRPLAEDWRWRHVWLAIKHRYLGNHAWQIKRYCGSMSWSFGRLVIFPIFFIKKGNINLKNLSVYKCC